MNAHNPLLSGSTLVARHLEIQDRIREAAETLRLLPEPDMRYLLAGNRSCMPAVVRSYWECYGLAAARAPRIPPSAREISEMEETLGWLTWLGAQCGRQMRIAWLCFGRGLRSGRVAKIMNCDRRTVARLRKAAIERLVKHLS